MNVSIICVDEGHTKSGADFGASGNDIVESVETRVFGNLLIQKLHKLNIIVDRCTVDYANSVSDSINKRIAISKQRQHDLILIIHFNSHQDPSANGCELFILPNRNGNYSSTASFNKNKAYGEAVLEAVCKAGGFFKREGGVKYREDLGMLLYTNDYAVYLEMCFISNKSDADKYKANKDKIATAIAEVLAGKKLIEEKPPVINKPEEEKKHMKYCATYCNEVDKEFAETLGKLLNCHVLDARISTNWRNMAETLIAVGGDNPNKGVNGQCGFSGYTNVFIKGKDRKETLKKIHEYAQGK